MYKDTLFDYLGSFVCALIEQLKVDQERWGNTWKGRPREGQEERAFARFTDYFDQFKHTGKPIPWLKITGEALIAWVREQENK